MRAVLVANPKGGAGKTTLATNLAGHFANQGKKTTLCDLDRQQSALRWMAFRDPALAFQLSFVNKCDEAERPLVAEYFQRVFQQELAASCALGDAA